MRPEEVLEAGVGTEGVVCRLHEEPTQGTIPFFVRSIQPLKRKVDVVHADVRHRKRQCRDVGRFRELLQSAQ